MQKKSFVFVVAGLISLLLSFWIGARETVINTDAICYLQSAADMKLGLHVAMNLCDQSKWPFYSALIYAVASLTTLSFVTSAYCINAIFSLLSTLVFIAIIRFVSQQPRIVWLAAAVILLSHEFNSVKQYVIRDHGFWAFYLTSILFLLYFFRSHHWRYAIAWSVSLVVATLFRVEGVIFLLAIPLISFFDGQQRGLFRLKSFLQLNTITLLGGLLLSGWIVTHPAFDVTRLHEVQFQIMHGASSIVQHFTDLKQALALHVLGPDSAHDAGLILFLMMLSWYFVSVAINVSLVYTVLIIYAWSRRLMHAENFIRLVLWSYLIVNVLVTASFLSEHMFLSKRYLIALSLILMLWVPFALDNLIAQWQVRKWPLLVAVFFIFVSSLGGIFNFGHSKQYIREAGDWLSMNAPQNASIYSNDYQVMYYSNHFGDDVFKKTKEFADVNVVSNGKWKQYDYLAIHVDKKNESKTAAILNEISYNVVKVFESKHDEIRIYRRISL